MNQVKDILLPIDFSPCAENALIYVSHMMSLDDTLQLFLLHVDDHSTSSETTHDQLNEIVQSLPTHIKARTQALRRIGELIPTILEAQRDQSFDLIVMGTEGKEINQPDAESHTSRLLREADCPVLIIPATANQFRISQIALALDKQEIDDTTTLGLLHDIARWFGSKVHVLTVGSPSDAGNKSLGTNQDNLEYYLDTLDYHYAFSENEDIEKGIDEYIDHHAIDILAILPRTHARKKAPSPGKLTKLLALHTRIPLLIID